MIKCSCGFLRILISTDFGLVRTHQAGHHRNVTRTRVLYIYSTFTFFYPDHAIRVVKIMLYLSSRLQLLDFIVRCTLLALYYTQSLNCRGDARGRAPLSRVSVPHRDLASPHRDLSAGWSDEKEPASTNKSHKFRSNIVPNCSEDLFFFLVFT